MDKTSIFHTILLAEGGYTDHHADNGGTTTWGITLSELKKWRAPKPVSVSSMKKLTKKEAFEIYDAWYWRPLRCGEMPPPIAYLMFDTGLLHGIGKAARWLQEAVGAEIDGNVGKLTIAKLKETPLDYVIDKVTEKRLQRAYGHPDRRYFLTGWVNRINSVKAQAKDALSAG
jgi:lysozyme family protein